MKFLTIGPLGGWRQTVVFVAPVVVLAAGACGDPREEASPTARLGAEARAGTAASQTPTPILAVKGTKAVQASELTSAYPALPRRSGPSPETTGGVPHTQIDVDPVPAIHDELFRRTFALPDVENRPTIVSLPGTRGVWISEGVSLAHPEVIVAGREFTHIHSDGSLHTPLPFSRALEAVDSGWAERHPWADQREGWGGLVLLFTPQSMEELDVVFQLIVESYNFVTGRDVEPSESLTN